MIIVILLIISIIITAFVFSGLTLSKSGTAPGPVPPPLSPTPPPPSPHWKCVVDTTNPICDYQKTINDLPSCNISSPRFPLPKYGAKTDPPPLAPGPWLGPGDDCSIFTNRDECLSSAYLRSLGDIDAGGQSIGAVCIWNKTSNECENPRIPQCVGYPNCTGQAVQDCTKQPVETCVGKHNENHHLCQRVSSSKESIYYYPAAYRLNPSGSDMCLDGGQYFTCVPQSPTKDKLQSTDKLPSCMTQFHAAWQDCSYWNYRPPSSFWPDPPMTNQEQQKACHDPALSVPMSKTWVYGNDYDRNSTNTGYNCKIKY